MMTGGRSLLNHRTIPPRAAQGGAPAVAIEVERLLIRVAAQA
jgi:hypothetical protein